MDVFQGSEKIDIFTHILPPRYKEALDKKARHGSYFEFNRSVPALWNLSERFRIMDEYEGLRHVLTIASPPLEMVTDGAGAIELAKMANDEMAELIAKYPDRFIAGVACLPMNNIDAALSETDRAITELNLKGVQLYTPINGKPLDSPEFMDLYDKMAAYNLPIWIHPARDRDSPDYMDESHSRYGLFLVIGWPYETTLGMARLVYSGVLERYPGIKFITHHCGGMVPFFAQRLGGKPKQWLSRLPVEYLQMFYGDTATIESIPGLMCGYAFFGADHMVFATDMPYAETGQTIISIESMEIGEEDKRRIFEGNAKRLLQLTGQS
ncbi:MAG: amidohydrolase family protein [Pseudomonadota bacterium]